MRTQSIELLEIAKELRDYIKSLNLPMNIKNEEGEYVGASVPVSDRVRVHFNSLQDYCSMELSAWPKTVNVALFEVAGYSNNTVTINVELVDDVELEAIILLVQADVAIFKASKLINDVQGS